MFFVINFDKKIVLYGKIYYDESIVAPGTQG